MEYDELTFLDYKILKQFDKEKLFIQISMPKRVLFDYIFPKRNVFELSLLLDKYVCMGLLERVEYIDDTVEYNLRRNEGFYFTFKLTGKGNSFVDKKTPRYEHLGSFELAPAY